MQSWTPHLLRNPKLFLLLSQERVPEIHFRCEKETCSKRSFLMAWGASRIRAHPRNFTGKTFIPTVQGFIQNFSLQLLKNPQWQPNNTEIKATTCTIITTTPSKAHENITSAEMPCLPHCPGTPRLWSWSHLCARPWIIAAGSEPGKPPELPKLTFHHVQVNK